MSLISREEVINAICEHGTDLERRGITVLAVSNYKQATVDLLESLPAAQPHWIPISERPPEDLEEVNVTWINHNPEPYYNFIKDKPFTATAVYYKEKWYWYSSSCVDLLAEYGRNPNEEIDDGIEIIAWMPLPEPYKEVE